MGSGKGNGNLIEKLIKLRKLKLIITIGGPVLLGLLVVMILFFAISSSVSGIMPILTSSSMSGVETIYDDTNFVKELEDNFELWDYDTYDDDGNLVYYYSKELPENNNFFQELRRQRKIWTDDYSQYGVNKYNITNSDTNDIDLVKIIVPTHYQGDVNLLSYEQKFDEAHDNIVVDENGTLLSEYEGEKNVANRDTRDFFDKAKKNIGSSIIISPGNRKLVGHMISTKVKYERIQYHDGHDPNYPNNLGTILSDWSFLSKILSENESDINSYYHDPVKATQKFNYLLQNAFYVCYVSEDVNSWDRNNYCYDYDLTFKEFGLSMPTKTEDINLESLIIEATNEEAAIPNYSIDSYGQHNYLKDGEYYFAVHITRENDDELYEDYLKKAYITSLYIDCEGCGYANYSSTDKDSISEKIYREMLNYESTYRYINREYFEDGASPSMGGGTHNIPNVEYNCSDGKLPNLATYPGHGGIDINGVAIGTEVYPLFSGTVYSVSRDNANCAPKLNAIGGYTCKHCGGTGYGNLVIIKGTAADGQEYYAYYGHLSSINVSVGQSVDINTKIGGVGNTGCSTGAHLHLELRKTSNGSKVFADTIYNKTTVASVLCSRSKKEE